MTGIPINGKTIDYQQLLAELATASIQVNGLGSDGVLLFTYAVDGTPADPPAGTAAVLAAHVAGTALHDALVTALTSSVGVTLTALTQAQRLALIAGLLYRAGAIDRHTLQVRPLNTWLLPS